MSSFIVRLTKRTANGIVDVNGKNCTLRISPFSTDAYSLSALPYEDGFYYGSITSSDDYKLFVNGIEETSFGADEGFYIATKNTNGWTFDRINSIRLSTSSNNVVIGTDTADANKLAVFGNASVSGSLYVSGTINNSSLSSLTSGLSFNQYTLTSNFVSTTSSLTGAKLLSKTSSQIYLTNAGDSLRLGNASGVSAMKLEVQGQVLIGNTTYYGVNAERGRITWGGTPQNFSLYSLSSFDLVLGTENSGEVIRATSGGNVGINTSTPQQKLDVNGAVNFRSALFFGTTGEKGTLTFTNGDFIVRSNAGHNLQLGTNFINVVTVASSLNVGINTTTPNNKFSVSGDTSITGALSVTSGRTSLSGGAIVRGDGTNAILQLYTGAGSNLWNFRNNGILDIGAGTLDFTSDFNFNNSVIFKSANANVGIGTMLPNSKLAVSGNISNTGNFTSSSATDIGLFVLSSGRVGINQSAPTVALEVSGSLVGGMSFSLGKGSPSASIGFAFNRHFPTGAIYDSSRYAYQFTRPSNADRLQLEVYNGAGTLINANTLIVNNSNDAQGRVGIGVTSPATKLDVEGSFRVAQNSISSSTQSGVAGQICWDTDYIFVCTATNTWKRAALSSW